VVTDVKALVDAGNGIMSPRIFADSEVYEQELEKFFGRLLAFPLPRIPDSRSGRFHYHLYGRGPGPRNLGEGWGDKRLLEYPPTPGQPSVPGGFGVRLSRISTLAARRIFFGKKAGIGRSPTGKSSWIRTCFWPKISAISSDATPVPRVHWRWRRAIGPA